LRILLPVLAALTVLGFGGCQTPTTFPQPTAAWQTSLGQLRYAGPERSVIGEVVVRRDGTSNFQLQFASGPGFPLLKLLVSGGHARAEGLFARGAWEGTRGSAPARLQGWMQLPEAFAQVSKSKKMVRSSTFEATAVFNAEGALTQLGIVTAATGERFTFVFSK
jgi:hypothetical protein